MPDNLASGRARVYPGLLDIGREKSLGWQETQLGWDGIRDRLWSSILAGLTGQQPLEKMVDTY